MADRQQLLKTISAQIISVPAERIVKVAIDGVDGAGKTTFADELATIVSEQRPVIRASVDGFHYPRTVRYHRGKESPEGFFRDSYDYESLKGRLLDPLSTGGSCRYLTAVFDSVTDLPVSSIEQTAAPSSILLLDGIFLHRPELLSYWDASIFLRVDFAVSVARGARRDGTSPDPSAQSQQRYVEGQKLYFRECDPEAHATIVIDYNDLENPRVLARRIS